MSYEIVRSLSIKKGRITIESSSNNVSPLCFTKWEYRHGLRNLLREISDGMLEIRPSANKYRWAYVNDAFERKLERRLNLKWKNLQDIDEKDDVWREIEDIYNERLREADEIKNDKYIVHRFGFYASGRISGKRFYITEEKEEAMNFNAWEAKYLEKLGWTAEKVVF